jgi:hypothetical protein
VGEAVAPAVRRSVGDFAAVRENNWTVAATALAGSRTGAARDLKGTRIMDLDPKAEYVVPNPRIPKVLGILNILFASVLLIGGLCSMGTFALSPAISRTFMRMQKEAVAKQQAQKKTALDGLDEQEKAAATAEEKQEIEARRKVIQSAPDFQSAVVDPWEAFPIHEKRFQIYMGTDLLSALVLNLVMLAAGIGLVQRAEWGRKLGIWDAWLKIVRLVLVYGYLAIAIVPDFSTAMAKFAIESIARQQQALGRQVPAGLSYENLAFVYSVGMTVGVVGTILFGSIYPAISLWLLTRRSARAACDPANRLREEGQSW